MEMMSDKIEHAIEHTKHLMPDQGPLPFFVHHNTIHHFETYDFFEGVKQAGRTYGAKAFMSEEEFLLAFERGRITADVLQKKIKEYIEHHKLTIQPDLLFKLMTEKPHVRPAPDARILQFVNNTAYQRPGYYKEAIQITHNRDIDELIQPVLFRFLSSYFDFGLAYWPMPNREKGMWQCFCEIYSKSSFFSTKFLKTLKRIVTGMKRYRYDEAITLLLQYLAIPENHMEDYMFRTLYRYKGWTGTIKSLEKMPEWIPSQDIKAVYKEVIPVILILELAAIKSICDLRDLKIPVYKSEPLYNPYFIAAVVSALGIKNDAEFPREVTQFTEENRQEIWQRAYEDTFYTQFLSAYRQCAIEEKPKYELPCYQVFCCIDDREESFRRHLEQIDPGVETLGAAGHFALDMRFKGAPEKHYRKMCPHPMVTPSVQVYEEAVKLEDAMPKKLQLYGEIQWAITQASKTLFGSFAHTIFSGILNLFPYTLDVLSPKYSSKLRRSLAAHEPKTRLVYRKENQENEKGWDLQGRITRATAILKGSGLSDNFSSYMFFLGHGSSSLNNPHEAAHDCGACAGGRGAPNGRLFATICNEPEVRAGLAKNGIIIPDSTLFIGGYHNTCSDEVILFDLPDPIEPRLQKYIDTIRRAAALDAKERCRRFDEVKTDQSEKAFADYARGRAMDLTQPRPEYGHCTNAIAIVGPRYLTRNLFLDRRAFLVSYNYTVDPEGKFLRAILGAVGPVCAGISLEYYFSFIDNEHYGCGTKLPHNVTSLLGVMNGYISDLQLGLPWQMVEVHEPTRLILLVCCKIGTMETILGEAFGYTNQPGHFQCLVKHNWITLAVHDQDQEKLFLWKGGVEGRFVPFEDMVDVPEYKGSDPRFFLEQDHLLFGKIT
ncbi:MAG: DUF2309 domain-containing protein [Candidatus Jettenia sp.]|nr:MAG: DUF2309 domain-containing protein [Candidatus Jettenia sp. AMX1]MBC6928330.1 DUF2309 domain-containing protein [Candidatus Jettenia sp.]GIL20226.1 MAG: hypothetical protein BroJett041_13400 [Candidatus Jettenia caeni]MCE7880697.1 DUF2309 domain-containing protein [Candidatus Jettenia sp. AMX1]MCQ3926395.1 DUF2309 domain-containing protein [Candidatus Jettenia sp.]